MSDALCVLSGLEDVRMRARTTARSDRQVGQGLVHVVVESRWAEVDLEDVIVLMR